MPTDITDKEIDRLLKERKPVSPDFDKRIVPKKKGGHKGAEIAVVGDDGHAFVIIVRQSISNPLDFSVILAYEPSGTNQRFILCRYNGKSYEHGNKLEGGGLFYDYHIHMATERYQLAGMHEEHFAELTSRYSDWRSALDCLVSDCCVIVPPGEGDLFKTV